MLDQVKASFQKAKSANTPLAAVVVEPISYETGQEHSSSFLQELRSLSSDNDAALIVDERNSGCGASGKGFWAYDGPSDYVVFGKRT